MIKFKKMSKLAKVSSVVTVAAVSGVALLPVINTAIDNPKAKVSYYEFNNMFYKSKDDAEAARSKFTAMSGLVSLMGSQEQAKGKMDFKPLMAEFVSFVSKLFVVKVFEMDDASSKDNHFQYDGMTDEQKSDFLASEVKGEIKYGDLTDITSAVKYANAKKDSNGWMFTPVDEMLLSILGDGSGQAYSQNELDYAEIEKTITQLKNNYESTWKKEIVDNFDAIANGVVKGIAIKDVKGVTHHNDGVDDLEMADHSKEYYNANGMELGDGSGDEYTAELIQKYQQWGTLKSTFEASKTDLDEFVSDKNINLAMKPIFEEMVQKNAKIGWNNKERYSTDEIELRNLLARVASEKQQLGVSVIPGGHTDTKVNIVQGWNWAPTGDRTGNDYEKWQLQLAEDIQNREKLMALHLTSAPDGAVIGKNYKPTGDGTGNTYSQTVFDIKDDLEKTQKTIGDLTSAIDLLVTGGTVAAPDGGDRGVDGKHQDMRGKGDDVDYSTSWKQYHDLQGLKNTLQKAKDAQKAFEDKLKGTYIDIQPKSIAGKQSESDIIENIIDFSTSVEGENFMQNYNQDQVDLTETKEYLDHVKQQIQDFLDHGVKPAPDGAIANNQAGSGDKTGNFYTQAQIDLREALKLQSTLGLSLSQLKSKSIRQAAKDGVLTQNLDGSHSEAKGLGNNEEYSVEFVEAAVQYRKYISSLRDTQSKIKAIMDRYPGGMKDPVSGKTFKELLDSHAAVGKNTPEQFTQAEIDYTAESKKLEDLVNALAAANGSLAEMTAHIGDKQAEKLREDADGKKLVPQVGENFEAAGDETGNTYSQTDKDYTDDLKLLKQTFPDGNPWWSTSATKTSDAAYASLYKDWVDAVKGGTLATNTEKTGDGTVHGFDRYRFNTYEEFLKGTISELHAGDAAQTDRYKEIESALSTISYYIINHGSLKPDSGYADFSEKSGGDTKRSGDASGHTYIKVDEVYGYVQDAYLRKGQTKSLVEKIANEDKLYTQLKNHVSESSNYQQKLTAAQKIIDDYAAALLKIQQAGQPFNQTHVNADGDKEAAQRKLDADTKTGAVLQGLSEDRLKELSSLSLGDNGATKYSAQQLSDLNELNGIDAKISDAQEAFDIAQAAWGDVQSNEHDTFIKYTQLDMKHLPTTGENKLPTGTGDGKYYSQDLIDGRDYSDLIKAAISKHFTTQSEKDAEYKKILKLQTASSEGENFDASSSKHMGDQSGLTWEKWELNQLSRVTKLNEIHSRINSWDFAPEGAVFATNFGVKGDQSGNTYDSDDDKYWINTLIPKYQKLEKAAEDTKTALDTLKARKTTLSAQGLDASLNLDPATSFKTPSNKIYSIAQFNAAKTWLVDFNALKAAKKASDDARVAWDAEHKKEIDFINKNKDAQKNAADAVKYNQGWINFLTPENEKKYEATLKEDNNKLKEYETKIKAWWKNGGKNIDSKQSGSLFAGIKTSTDYDKFVSDDADIKSGSLFSIIKALEAKKSNLDGTLNIKPAALHSQEDLDLRDALAKIVKIPSWLSQPKTAETETEIFNSLFMMYDYQISKRAGRGWTKPAEYSSPSHDKPDLIKNGNAHYRIYKDVKFDVDGTKRTAIMSDFEKWLWSNYLNDDTQHQNIPMQGNGKNEKFDVNFFSYNHHSIKSEDDIKNSKIGAAALVVSKNYGTAKIMTSKSVIGGPKSNDPGTGDKSGNPYSPEAIAYYNKYLKNKKDAEAVKTQQAVVDKFKPTDGTVLIKVPDSFKGTAAPKHSTPLGDGSGNTYTQQLIDDAKAYFAYSRKAASKQKEIDALQTHYESLSEKRTWDEVKTIDPAVEVGNNHETWWTQAELDYEGVNIQSSEVSQKIKDLLGQMIVDPTKAGPTGTGSTTMVKLTPAPDNAKQGYNAEPLGLHDGKIYSQDQLDMRENLKNLNTEALEAQAEIDGLEAKLKAEHVQQAPKGAVAVPDSEWHKVNVGDGTGNTYAKALFDDKKTLDDLKDTQASAQKAKDDFVNKLGQAAVDKIINEVEQEKIVDGMNNAEKYSDSEIALRDQTAKLGATTDHLHVVQQSGDNFGISQTLTPDSEVGKNVEKVGLGNDETYTQEQLDFRDLIIKITQEEKLHGITSEQMFAKVKKYVNEDSSMSKEDAERAVETTLDVSVGFFYSNIDLKSAIEGANHVDRGDSSGAYYSQGNVNVFTDIKALQNQMKLDAAAAKALQDKGVKSAPSSAVAITQAEVDAAKIVDPTETAIAGEHKAASGDETGNIYKQDYIDEAYKYVQLRKDFDDASTKYNDFLSANTNEAAFFEYKTINGKIWNPVVGRNWASYQFDYKKLYDEKEALKVGRTMVSLDPGVLSSYGTNRGEFGKDTKESGSYVLYKGDDNHIGEKVLGSDKARIAYVLNPSKISEVSDEAPVFTSLKAVSDYLQNHPELVSKDLMNKFNRLNAGELPADEKYKIEKVTVSKDTFRTMQENYKWGDE